jgi:2-methylcitrate dehydratase
MSDTLVQRLARWALDFDATAVDARAVELMKHSVLDALGVAILTLEEDCVQGVLRYAREAGGAQQASMIGGGKAPLALATLVNGTLVRAIDLNDHLAMDPRDGAKLGGHPSDHLAAVLAVADWRDLAGSQVIGALLAGYEIYGRVYKMFGAGPWDHTTCFSFSVPAIASRLMGLDEDKTANAIALAGAQSISLGVVRRGQLSHSKFLASSLIAERGMEAACLAAAGLTGSMTLFEDQRGFAKGVLRADETLEPIVAPFANPHMIDGVTIKAFPGMDTTQAATEAALKALAGRRLRAQDIAGIDLVMNDHPMTRDQTADPDRRVPNSRETADHSYYYLVAATLLDGEMTPRQFAPGRWFAPDICDLMARMTIKNDPAWTKRAPGGFPCSIRLRTTDGADSFVEVDFAIGHARNKMTRAQIVEKFRACADGRISPSRADEIIAAVDNLDRLASIRELIRLLP